MPKNLQVDRVFRFVADQGEIDGCPGIQNRKNAVGPEVFGMGGHHVEIICATTKTLLG